MSSKVSNAPSPFTSLNENDPLLVFLRSQESCIKGSVDEFYTWLIESEDIDSMMALKDAVSDTNYLNNTMKKGNGISGLKGFKREVFQSAVQEYVEEDNGDTNNEKRIISQVIEMQKQAAVQAVEKEYDEKLKKLKGREKKNISKNVANEVSPVDQVCIVV